MLFRSVIKQVNRDNPPTGALEEYKERKPFTQTVEFEQPLDVLPARGMPLAGMQATNGEVSPPARYSLDLTDAARNAALPSEMQRLADELRLRLRQGTTIPGQGQLQRLLPPDLRVVQANRRGAEIAGVDVQRTDPFPADFSSIRPATAIIRGLQYTILSSVSKASVEQLRAASSDLPGWAKDEYLQLPGNVPERVRSLALEWTQASTNTMDRALAIEARLRDYQYDTNIPAPPRDMDEIGRAHV